MEAIDTQSAGGDDEVVAVPIGASTGNPVLRRRTDAGTADPAVIRALKQFFRTGTIPPGTGIAAGLADHVPALLYPYLSHPALRTPWPVVLDETDGTPILRTLTAWFDDLVAAVGDSGDEGELRRRFLARVEEAIRTTDLPDDSNLEEAWWAAVDAVRPGIRSDRRETFEECVRSAASHVSGSARLVGCSSAAPLAIARAHAQGFVAEMARPVVEEIDRLRTSLQNLLDVEQEESADAVVPERLRGSAGGAWSDAFDFDALSHLLDEAPHAAGLPPERRERLQTRTEGLVEHAAALFGKASSVLRPYSIRGAREAVAERTERLLALYRHLEAARLEVAHRYRPELHDTYLDALTPAMLSPEDFRRCPPLFVQADEAALDAAGAGHILELLSGPVPVKVLLVLRGAADDPEEPSSVAALTSIAIGQGRACVVQTALSDVDTLSDGIAEAVRHDGPALVAVHAGAEGTDLPTYFAAAVARDGRAAPSLVFRPGVGRPWADRLSVDGNDAAEADWTRGSVAVTNEDGTVEEVSSAFTWLDYAATCASLSGFFVPVEPGVRDEAMIPADEFLARSATERAGTVPFVLCASSDGWLVQAVPARPLVCAAERALDRWRRLQELAGIGNSFAERAVSEVRARAEAERDEAIASAREAHAAEMDRSISSVAEAIVSNIAASLLDLPAGAPTPARRPAPAATVDQDQAAPDAPAAAEPEPVEEEAGEALALDEAYIETIRCTSCNECTNLNKQLFAYNDEKQAFIKDASAGPYRDLVTAAEKCPVRIIHPGKPLNADEPGLDDLLERAKPFL